MPIFQVTPKELKPLSQTSFGAESIMERKDIQRLLRDQIGVVDERLMVIAEEFGDWLDSSRRIDLLCIDSDANLVVVELKRTDDGGLMELQALRYAAMVSAMRFEQLCGRAICIPSRSVWDPGTFLSILAIPDRGHRLAPAVGVPMREGAQTDWEAIEAAYRAGVLSLREIARQHGLAVSTLH